MAQITWISTTYLHLSLSFHGSDGWSRTVCKIFLKKVYILVFLELYRVIMPRGISAAMYKKIHNKNLSDLDRHTPVLIIARLRYLLQLTVLSKISHWKTLLIYKHLKISLLIGSTCKNTFNVTHQNALQLFENNSLFIKRLQDNSAAVI